MSDINSFSPESFGEVKSDIKSIKESINRIEASIIRYGERTERLEKGQSDCEKQNAVMLESVNFLKEDVKDFKDTRKKITWAVVGSYIAQGLQFFHK